MRIILEHMVINNDIKTQFRTKNPSKKEIDIFFNDATAILKALEPKIDEVSDTFYFRKLLTPWKFDRIEKNLMAHENQDVSQIHNIIYRSNHIVYDQELESLLKKNIFRGWLISTDLSIDSINATYDPKQLAQEFGKLPYISTSRKFRIFDFVELIQAAENPNKYLTKTGNILTLYKS